MQGRKLYYEKATGTPVLLTEERLGPFAASTTREQDFAIYRELSEREPESVGLIELEVGQYRGDFEKATAFRVNLETEGIEFELPAAFQSHEAIIHQLEEKIAALETENTTLKEQNLDAMEAIASIYESQV